MQLPISRDLDLEAILTWIVASGLAGRSAQEVVAGVGERLGAAGLPLRRINVILDTLHPVHEGHVFRWRSDAGAAEEVSYGRNNYDAGTWQASPFFHLTSSGLRQLRRRLSEAADGEFPVLAEYRADGLTDYLAIADEFGAAGSVGDMDCVYSSWMTDAPEGFRDRDIRAIDRLTPVLALAMKAASLSDIARTLVRTYLGRDAGQRVLGGRIVRGVADRIDAVLWYSDLRGYTAITDTSAPEQVIPLLNDYADPVVSAVHANGGDVVKFMGDGLLAMFVAEGPRQACEAALAAARLAQQGAAEISRRRQAGGLLATDLYLALHAGPVFYGNIGSDDRLDFTVVGPTVNEVSRIAAMCRSVDRPILMSAAFASEIDPERRRFASVGRYALRGVGRPQELFTTTDDD